MNTYFVRKSGRLIWEETFEITTENVNRCVMMFCTRLMVSLQPTSVKGYRKRFYMYKKGVFWVGFRPCPLKINTAVDEGIESQSWYQIRKGSIKGLKTEKAK